MMISVYDDDAPAPRCRPAPRRSARVLRLLLASCCSNKGFGQLEVCLGRLLGCCCCCCCCCCCGGGKCPTTLCRRRLNATPAPLQGFSVTGCNMTHDQIQCNNPRYPHCLLFMEGGTDGGYIAHNHFQMGCCSFCGEKRTPQCMQTPRCFQCAGLFAPRWNVLRRIVRLQCKRGHTGGQPVL